MENKEVAVIKTSQGEMTVEFWPDVAPKTVENFKKLAKEGFYDGTAFHRIVKGFMIQGGDPLTKDAKAEGRWGTGDPGYKIKAEFSDRPHVRGVLSMARSQDPNSAGSQFFICLADARFLDKQYTAFGKVIAGDDVLGKLGDAPTTYSGGGERSRPIDRASVESVKIVPAPRQIGRGVIEPWTQISSQPWGDFKVFSVRSVMKKSPATGRSHEFFIIDSVNWVNVIALTPDRKLIMVEQYRHGSDTVELEVPGGMIDAGDAGPEAAAARELREETGYTGGAPRVIGKVFPNPAIMSNTCFTVLLEDCRLTAPTHFDQTEELVTRLVPVEEIPRLVAGGKIRHTLVVTALYHFDLLQRGQSA